MDQDGTLHIAEVPYDTGEIRFRFERRLSDDGTTWIRHGLFIAYHRNGAVSSEGKYDHDLEQGTWRDFHENGQLAAEGVYLNGKERGVWKFWSPDGIREPDTVFDHGNEQSS